MAARLPRGSPCGPSAATPAQAHLAAVAARPRAPAVSAEKENQGASNIGPGKQEKKATPAAAKAPPALKPSSLQAHMEGEEAPLAAAPAAAVPRVHGAEGEGATATSAAAGVVVLRGVGPLRQRGCAGRVLGHPANRALLCRPLPLDVGRCTCVVEGQGRQDRKLAVARHRRRRGRSEFILAQNQDGVFCSSDKNFLGTLGANLVGSKYHIWGQMTKRYELDFRERVGRMGYKVQTSVKNFQMTLEENGRQTLLQLGRVGKSKYIMDFRYPLTGYQAFCICLASMDWKLCSTL
ncbi:hypothetical protein ACQ4PT_025162 [Festuca glaucescens]